MVNAINQLVVLALMGIYYVRGLKALINKWYILIASTSIILVLEIAYQFMQQTGILARIKANNAFWQNLNKMWYDWLAWMGFYTLTEPTYIFFLPYILLFAFATIMRKRFEEKAELEEKQLIFEDNEIQLLTDGANESEESKEQREEFRVNSSEQSSFRETKVGDVTRPQHNPMMRS